MSSKTVSTSDAAMLLLLRRPPRDVTFCACEKIR